MRLEARSEHDVRDRTRSSASAGPRDRLAPHCVETPLFSRRGRRRGGGLPVSDGRRGARQRSRHSPATSSGGPSAHESPSRLPPRRGDRPSRQSSSRRAGSPRQQWTRPAGLPPARSERPPRQRARRLRPPPDRARPVPGKGADVGRRLPDGHDERILAGKELCSAPNRVLGMVRSVVADEQWTVPVRGRGMVDVISRGHDVIVASRARPDHGHRCPYPGYAAASCRSTAGSSTWRGSRISRAITSRWIWEVPS
jgi:hypothetical protein